MATRVLTQKLFGFTLHRHVHRQLRDHFIPHPGNQHRPHVLHHRVLALYSVLLVVVKVSALAMPLLLPYSTLDSAAVTPDNIIQLTNQSRTDAQLPALQPNPKLMVAAGDKARDMMDKAYFAHFSPDGVSPWYWIVQSGYAYSYAGENLAIRFTTAEGVNDAWLASPAHRANILSKDFTEIGVAALTDTFGEQGTVTLVVQMFGTPAKLTHASVAKKAEPKRTNPTIVRSATAATPKKSEPPPSPAPDAPTITFPLDNSFVNTNTFQILGQAAAGQTVAFFIDGQSIGTSSVRKDNAFSFKVPASVKLTDGGHRLEVGMTGGQKSTITFQLDTEPPKIYSDKFSMSTHLGDARAFDVKAGVSDDSIRTIVSIGQDSAVLEKGGPGMWAATITLYHRQPKQTLPIEILAQDIAGNQSKQRVGTLNDGQVQGLYSFVSGSSGGKTLNIFGLTFKVGEIEKFLKNFYLYFVAFLAFALILKIAIARHVQHVKTIAGVAAVMIFAMVLFVI